MAESKVKVDGEEAVLHITDQSVMFERSGKVTGFERSAIRMVKPDGDAMIIAYFAGSKVESIRVEPMAAVSSLLVPCPNSTSVQVPVAGLDDVLQRLYLDARKELEERLDTINKEPEDMSLRLTEEEFQRFVKVRNQMYDIIGAKHHFDPYAPGNSIGFVGLDGQPHEMQVDELKSLHINFLLYLATKKAESNDVAYETADVWPEEWDIILPRFGMSGAAPLPTERWKNYLAYLRPKWTHYQKGNKTPALARP
ncbi:MAG: hypothetical protein JRN45_10795 [Nitrososphaerota archaeon]|nr:hypothetical protein [Nitrososphaerota archaeon]